MLRRLIFTLAMTLSITSNAKAENFKLTSSDIQHGNLMGTDQEFTGFGCEGKNLSPHLSWSNPPKGTKSFALTVYDPDAPTGSGWWHWQVINLPISLTELKTGAGNQNKPALPKQAVQIENDYGVAAFGGACPPKGHGQHRYQFKLHALSVEKLDLTSQSSSALAGYMINANTINTATLEALYERN